MGSIPACTGEPTPRTSGSTGPRVYPRVYGGTLMASFCRASAWGLSPRVRGNRDPSLATPVTLRSIPACTGEPVLPSLPSLPVRVYPRVYGGTFPPRRLLGLVPGLSPRVRGNPTQGALGARATRSIPACTGEPRRGAWSRRRSRVYPRVYGGTGDRGLSLSAPQGLSPRVRGNRQRQRRRRRVWGSIPACTGEPVINFASDLPAEVYPRVYGGTDRTRARVLTVSGLSPRVRGNPFPGRSLPVGGGSIPACTGEPPGKGGSL